MNGQTQPTALGNESEVNQFARFFGALLIELRTHDLRLNRQEREHKSYAKAREMKSYSREPVARSHITNVDTIVYTR